MKKLLLLKILFVILVFQAQAANETVTIDGITYTLGSGESTYYTTTNFPITWGGIEYWAAVTGFSEDITEASIPKSIVHNGTEYFVRSISATVKNLTKLEIQNGVQLFWKSLSSSSSIYSTSVNTIVLGKNVRIFQTSSGQVGGTNNVTALYCKDDIPCMPSRVNTGTNNLHIYFGNLQGTTVYVPIGAEKTYQCTYGWSCYVNIIGSEECGDVTEAQNLDVNGDGDVTSADITMIYDYILGNGN